MPFSNYTELQAAIADWLSRSDLTAVIPDFVRLAESRLQRELRVSAMMKTVTGTLSVNPLVLPTDFMEIQVFTIGGTTPVSPAYLSPDTFASLPQNTGTSVYLTITNNQLYMNPFSSGSNYTLVYFSTLPPLSSNSTNWLLSSSPDVYLFGSLLEAAPYLLNDERVDLWQSRLTGALAEINGNDRRLRSKGMHQRQRVVW